MWAYTDEDTVGIETVQLKIYFVFLFHLQIIQKLFSHVGIYTDEDTVGIETVQLKIYFVFLFHLQIIQKLFSHVGIYRRGYRWD